MKKHRLDQKALKHGKWGGLAKEFPKPNPLVRKAHKETLRLAKLEVELNRKHPEPLSLFNKRLKAGEIPERPVRKGFATLGQIANAASAMADWDHSDPFAYNRTALYVRQGYLRSEEVVKEMTQRTIARRVAKAREAENAAHEPRT